MKPTPEMIAAIEAKKYRPEQGIDAEMASFNDGLDAAISIVRSALSSPVGGTREGNAKKVTIAREPNRSTLERLAHHWGYTLEETAEVYAVLIAEAAVPPSPTPTSDIATPKCDVKDFHHYAVVSSDYNNPFLLGAYETLERATRAQGGKPDKWDIFVKVDASDIAALREENERLKKDLKEALREANNNAYMAHAYRVMLGPIATELVKKWDEKGVVRQHTSWGPEAHKMTGEERAQALLDAFLAKPEPLEFNDGTPSALQHVAKGERG